MPQSTSLASEIQGKDHIFQDLSKPGPRGAYESRQVNGGLYVRVDMPGVPPDGVKLVKRGETRTVSFTGKAPVVWCEVFGRVYGGYVVLDRNPNDVDVEMTVVNGSVKLFFPACDGTLHFLARRSPVPKLTPGVYGDVCITAAVDEESNGSNKLSSSHINPFLLDGREGVIEQMMVADSVGHFLYLRIDMPGLEKKDDRTRFENEVTLICEGDGSLEYSLDEGGRTYEVDVVFQCTCCKMTDVKHVLKDGVLRVSIRKHTIPSSSGINCNIGIY